MRFFLTRVAVNALAFLVILGGLSFPISAQSKSTEADIALESGGLKVEKAPNIHFSYEYTESNSTSHSATGGASDFIIEDARGGIGGWALSVTLTDMVPVGSIPNQSEGLRGVKVYVPAPEIYFAEDLSIKGTGYPSVLVPGDGIFHRVAVVPPGAGGGEWIGSIGQGEIEFTTDYLHVYGTYRGKLIWQLEDTP